MLHAHTFLYGLVEAQEKKRDPDPREGIVKIPGKSRGIESEGALLVELVEDDIGVPDADGIGLLKLFDGPSQVLKREGIEAAKHLAPHVVALAALLHALEQPFQHVEALSERGEKTRILLEQGLQLIEKRLLAPGGYALLDHPLQPREQLRLLFLGFRDGLRDLAAAGCAGHHARGEGDDPALLLSFHRFKGEVYRDLPDLFIGLPDRRDRGVAAHAVPDVIESGHGDLMGHGDSVSLKLLYRAYGVIIGGGGDRVGPRNLPGEDVLRRQLPVDPVEITVMDERRIEGDIVALKGFPISLHPFHCFPIGRGSRNEGDTRTAVLLDEV
jgi:hypothetical protein